MSPVLRQPVGEPCVGLWTFACAVGGRGERAWGRLTRGFGAGQSGRVRADKHFFCLDGTSPAAPGGEGGGYLPVAAGTNSIS